MPPKRPSLEEPPSASSSSEDEEVENSEEEESEGEEEPAKSVQPSLKVPNGKLNPLPKPQSSDDDDDEEDEAEEEEDEAEEEKADLAVVDDSESSDSDNEPVKHMIASRNVPASDVKPISSKPMTDVLKPKKQDPTPTTTTAQPLKGSSANLKRPLEETNKDEKKDKKRKKKNVSDLEGEGDDPEETEKKAAEDQKNKFQRKWTEDDEIELLNVLRDYKKKGRNASADMSAFYEFVKGSIRVKFSKTQVQSKVQRLQKKYNTNCSKGKHGEDPVISVPHELKSFQISKEIWGDQISKDNAVEANNGGTDLGVAEGKKRKNKANINGTASPKRKVSQIPANSPEVEPKREADDDENSAEYLYLSQSLQCQHYPALPVPPQGLTNCIAKKGWDLIGSSKAETFDQKWKAVLIAETKAYLERIDVVRDQTKLMLDALESSDA